jgi:tyrosyl-tRNA synthetase
MGKTADGAVWLDEEMLLPFDYFQYFRNVTDEDVERFLKFFTNLTEEKISEIKSEEINKQKEILAFEATKVCHGIDAANQALSQAKSMFSDNVDVNLLPIKEIKFSPDEIKNGKKLVEILRDVSLCESGGEAKRLIKGGGVKVDDEKIDDENYLIKFDSSKPFFKVALGKKKMFKIMIQ